MKLKNSEQRDGDTIHTVEVEEVVTVTREYSESKISDEIARITGQIEIMTRKLASLQTEKDVLTELKDKLS